MNINIILENIWQQMFKQIGQTKELIKITTRAESIQHSWYNK